MSRVTPDTLVQHLQLVALVEGYHVSRGDLLALVNKNNNVRQTLQQLQLLCSSGLESPVNNDDTEQDSDDGEGDVDVKKWFKHLDSKTRRAGVAAPVFSLDHLHSSHQSQDHQEDWMTLLPGTRVDHPVSTDKYPLKQEDVPKSSYSRIDPLRNKDLFDDENSNDESETTEKPVDTDDDNNTLPKPSLSREQRLANYKSLQTLSRHLDIVSCWSLVKDDDPWHAPTPPSNSCSSSLPRYRDQTEHVHQVRKHLSDSIMPRSCDLVKESLGDESVELVKMKDVDKNRVWDSQQHVLFNSLVDIFTVDRRGMLDLVSGIRTLARGEEVRRVQSMLDSRRGNRFTHYFAHSEAEVEETMLIDLCNALQ